MAEVLMCEGCRYMLGRWLSQDASMASAGVVGEWMKQRVNARVPTDMVTSEQLTPRVSLGDRWGSQVLNMISMAVEIRRKQLRR